MVDVSAISSGLKLSDDGVWYASSDDEVSYPAEGHEVLVDIEGQSFWFRHRNACIAAVVEAHPPRSGDIIFDVGGGNGFVAAHLKECGWPVALVEPGRLGAANARARGVETVICARSDTAGFHDGSLDAVGLFDVIEHNEDDVAFLSGIHRLIRPGGRLYATVPAYQALWSSEDDFAGHFRRYTRRSLRRSLEAAGFHVDFLSYFFTYLTPAVFALRAVPYRLGLTRRSPRGDVVARDHGVGRGGLASLLGPVHRFEVRRLRAGGALRSGASCIVAATC